MLQPVAGRARCRAPLIAHASLRSPAAVASPLSAASRRRCHTRSRSFAPRATDERGESPCAAQRDEPEEGAPAGSPPAAAAASPPPPRAGLSRPVAGAAVGLCAALLLRAAPAAAAAASSAASAASSSSPAATSGALQVALQVAGFGLAVWGGLAARRFVRARTAAAVAKFKQQWKGALFIPVCAAVVGYVTNWIAVQMIFYPIAFFGLPLKQYVLRSIYGCDVLSPLGWVGWQGIVPAKAAQMALNIVTMVTEQLIDVQAVFMRLQPARVAELLSPEIPALALGLAADAHAAPWLVSFAEAKLRAGSLPGHVSSIVDDVVTRYLEGFTVALQAGVHRVLDLKELVVTAMVADRPLIVAMFQKCGEAELKFLVDSGLWFGFLLGLIQMLIWAFYDSPWTLTAGGAVVGYITNWAALKCIFEPVEPTKIGPFTIQGLFLTRQKEVSAEFADFFCDKVLTSRRMWDNMLHGAKSGEFRKLLTEHTCGSFGPATVESLTAGSAISTSLSAEAAALSGSACAAACERIADRLPEHLEALHPYVDAQLGLRATIKASLEAMSPAQFERVLHPIFEEDEMTLILAGAVLGAIAGYIQQITTVPDDGKAKKKDATAASPPDSTPKPST